MSTILEYVIVPDPDDDNPDSMPIYEGSVADATSRLIPGAYPCTVVYEFDDSDDVELPGMLFVGPCDLFPVSMGPIDRTFVSLDPCNESPCDVGRTVNGPHSHTAPFFVGYDD